MGYSRTCPVLDRVWDCIWLLGLICHGGRKPAAVQSLAADAHCATFHPVWNSFSCIHTTFFSKNTYFFSKTQLFSPKPTECSETLANLTVRTSDRTYPILETFLFLIMERRFGGVGAPEGRENVPVQHTKNTTFFLQHQHFPPRHNIFLQTIQQFSQESQNWGEQICGIWAVVDR